MRFDGRLLEASDGRGGMLDRQRWSMLSGGSMLGKTGSIGSGNHPTPTAKDIQRREQGHHCETPEMPKGDTQAQMWPAKAVYESRRKTRISRRT
ncbi:MAG: hypothetical protein ACJ788_09195 [Ktedonobacteraceae bacterium]